MYYGFLLFNYFVSGNVLGFAVLSFFPFFHMKTFRLKKIKRIAQGHITSKCYSCDSNLVQFDFSNINNTTLYPHSHSD